MTPSIDNLNTEMAESVRFLPSQLGKSTQTPIAYTGDPFKLLWSDFRLVCRVWSTVLGILWPMHHGKEAEIWDELYPSAKNLFALCLHLVLIPLQLAFMVSVPVALCLQIPGLWILLYVGGFLFANRMVCRLINGTQLVLEPSKDIIIEPKDDEYWIYLNGVSVGRDWLQSNIDRLSLTFGRRVIGVHNPTDGILFDLIQCLIQRNFCYSTEDIRAAYVAIKAALLKSHVKKVVFILHSQGGIEGGLIIDWLLDELPQDYTQKLEVYTFGNAANHFNNPVRSQRGHGAYEAHQKGDLRHHNHAIRHIEHYANQGDFVSQFGVLNYTTFQNRFMGRVFVSPGSGHLLNQHYLHHMFPIDRETRSCLDSNVFMEMDVDIGVEDTRVEGREDVKGSLTVKDERVAFVGDANSPVSPIKRAWSLVGDPEHGIPARPLKVKDFSRLWQYRNGGVPEETQEKDAVFLSEIVEEPENGGV